MRGAHGSVKPRVKRAQRANPRNRPRKKVELAERAAAESFVARIRSLSENCCDLFRRLVSLDQSPIYAVLSTPQSLTGTSPILAPICRGVTRSRAPAVWYWN